MSAKKFCHNCGQTVMVGSKFCPSCGTNLGSLSNTPTPEKPQSAVSSTFQPFRPRQEDEEDYDPTDSAESLSQLGIDPHRMKGLDIEISKPQLQNETIGSIASQGAMGVPATIDKRDIPPPTDPKKFLEDFKKEAGTLRNKND